jgi:glycosyltransferase involved in cell wall biosynthesis
MRIAQVAPLFETVPPRRYGGTERVVAWLVDGLVERGHEVTLFAAEGSSTRARLVAERGGRLGVDAAHQEALARHLALGEDVAAAAGDFDLVHFHLDLCHLPVARRLPIPSLTTLHGRLDGRGLRELYDTFDRIPLVSISDAQRGPLGRPRWAATVHHGLPPDLLRPGPGRGGYLAFLGRMAEDKGPHSAIAIARAAGLPLRIAAKIDATERAYFEERIRPLLGGDVTFVGEVDEVGKQAFLGDALALLFPIQWPEPFGLVMIEAMACGTPVIAFPAGSVPEVIDDGVTGFVVDGVQGAVDAIRRLDRLDRATVRGRFEHRFTVDRMVDRYVEVYADLVGGRAPSPVLDASREAAG